MLLKILVYSIAIWFFIRIIRRVLRVWVGSAGGQPLGRPGSSRPNTGPRRIDDVEEAEYTEIDDNR